jgi:predicted  nucleic acid-binding Zn-ribbon protein
MQNQELERRQNTCEKKWGDLLDENQRNSEAVNQLQQQLEGQRDSFTKMLALTDRRVV